MLLSNTNAAYPTCSAFHYVLTLCHLFLLFLSHCSCRCSIARCHDCMMTIVLVMANSFIIFSIMLVIIIVICLTMMTMIVLIVAFIISFLVSVLRPRRARGHDGIQRSLAKSKGPAEQAIPKPLLSKAAGTASSMLITSIKFGDVYFCRAHLSFGIIGYSLDQLRKQKTHRLSCRPELRSTAPCTRRQHLSVPGLGVSWVQTRLTPAMQHNSQTCSRLRQVPICWWPRGYGQLWLDHSCGFACFGASECKWWP